MPLWMKQTLIWLYLQRHGTGNGLSNIKDTFTESFQLQISVLHQSMCIFKTSLSNSYDGWAKYKEKVPDAGLQISVGHQTMTDRKSLTDLKLFQWDIVSQRKIQT